MSELSYLDGADCVWVACDREGHVGAFVTGGAGPIPLHVLASGVLALEDMETTLGRLPRVSAARLLVQIKRPDDFVAMAERGLFVYDWTDVQRTLSESIHAYEPIAVPDRPVTLEMIPEHLVPRTVYATLYVAFSDCVSLRWGKVGARLNASKVETGYLVYVDDGYLTTVEGYTYGDEWPESVDEIELYLLTPGMELTTPPH